MGNVNIIQHFIDYAKDFVSKSRDEINRKLSNRSILSLRRRLTSGISPNNIKNEGKMKYLSAYNTDDMSSSLLHINNKNKHMDYSQHLDELLKSYSKIVNSDTSSYLGDVSKFQTGGDTLEETSSTSSSSSSESSVVNKKKNKHEKKIQRNPDKVVNDEYQKSNKKYTSKEYLSSTEKKSSKKNKKQKSSKSPKYNNIHSELSSINTSDINMITQ